jgi:ATP-dependent RNA helicase RhlE
MKRKSSKKTLRAKALGQSGNKKPKTGKPQRR